MRPRSPAAVLGRQHELDAEVAEEIQIEQLGARAGRRRTASCDAARAQRFGERRERREPDAARDHPRLGRRIDDGERAAERTEAGDALARLARRRSSAVDTPMRLFSSEMPVGAPSRVAQHFEHRKRPAQQRVVAASPP